MIERVKQILTDPKTTWTVVESENTPHVKLFTQYVLPFALIPAIAAFIGYGLVGYSAFGIHIHSVEWGIRQAVSQFIAMTGGVYLTAFVINFLAENFGARKDFDRAFSLVAWAYMPMFVGGVFYVIPSLSWLSSLAGVYGLYLLYIGLEPMMKQPAEKTTGYFIACLVVAALVAVILSIALTSILLGSYGAATLRF
jgi:hypothetical protein